MSLLCVGKRWGRHGVPGAMLMPSMSWKKLDDGVVNDAAVCASGGRARSSNATIAAARAGGDGRDDDDDDDGGDVLILEGGTDVQMWMMETQRK